MRTWWESSCVACIEVTWTCLFIGCQGLITGREKVSWGNIRAGEGWSRSGQDGVSIWVALLLIHSALLWLHCQETFSLALDDDPPLAVMLPQLPLHTHCEMPLHKSKGLGRGKVTAVFKISNFDVEILNCVLTEVPRWCRASQLLTVQECGCTGRLCGAQQKKKKQQKRMKCPVSNVKGCVVGDYNQLNAPCFTFSISGS